MTAGRIAVTLPFSEVCVHVGVADRPAEVELRPHGMAQIFIDGRPFSFPVTRAEAGVRY